MIAPPVVGLSDQIACVERELRMRQDVYQRQVNMGRLTQKKADHELAAMEAVLATLRGLPDPEKLL